MYLICTEREHVSDTCDAANVAPAQAGRRRSER